MTNWSRSSLIYNMYCHNAPTHQAGLFRINNLCLADKEFRTSLEHWLSLSMCTVAFLTLDGSRNCTVPLSRIQILTLKNFPVFHILLARLISVQLAIWQYSTINQSTSVKLFGSISNLTRLYIRSVKHQTGCKTTLKSSSTCYTPTSFSFVNFFMYKIAMM